VELPAGQLILIHTSDTVYIMELELDTVQGLYPPYGGHSRFLEAKIESLSVEYEGDVSFAKLGPEGVAFVCDSNGCLRSAAVRFALKNRPTADQKRILGREFIQGTPQGYMFPSYPCLSPLQDKISQASKKSRLAREVRHAQHCRVG
jgi:hypothetical protein